MRRLPKPVVAMVAGYAIGGGHILHLCCDLTIAADNAASARPGRGSAPGTAASAPRCCATSSAPRRRRSSGCSAASTTPRRRWRWGWSTRSSRSTELERETVAWCREMLALSPFALRLVKASFNAHEDGYAGIQQLAHDANLLFYGSEEAARGPRGLQGEAPARLLQVPAAGHEDLADGGAAADAAGGDRAGAGRHRGGGAVGRRACRASGAFVAALVGSIFIQIGTNLANDYSDARRGADTADRLGPGAGHLGRAGDAAAGAATRPGSPSRSRSPAASTWPPSPGSVILADRRRSRSPPASSTPAGRGPTATPASARSSSSSSSAWSPSTAPTTCSSRSSTRCRSGSRSRSASSPPRSSSSTTSATSRPTGAPAR